MTVPGCQKTTLRRNACTFPHLKTQIHHIPVCHGMSSSHSLEIGEIHGDAFSRATHGKGALCRARLASVKLKIFGLSLQPPSPQPLKQLLKIECVTSWVTHRIPPGSFQFLFYPWVICTLWFVHAGIVLAGEAWILSHECNHIDRAAKTSNNTN